MNPTDNARASSPNLFIQIITFPIRAIGWFCGKVVSIISFPFRYLFGNSEGSTPQSTKISSRTTALSTTETSSFSRVTNQDIDRCRKNVLRSCMSVLDKYVDALQKLREIKDLLSIAKELIAKILTKETITNKDIELLKDLSKELDLKLDQEFFSIDLNSANVRANLMIKAKSYEEALGTYRNFDCQVSETALKNSFCIIAGMKPGVSSELSSELSSEQCCHPASHDRTLRYANKILDQFASDRGLFQKACHNKKIRTAYDALGTSIGQLNNSLETLTKNGSQDRKTS